MQQYSDVVLVTSTPGGQVRAPAAASVQVNINGGGAATLYSDNGITTRTNPIVCDSSGEYSFYAADGLYDLVISVTGFTTETKTAAVLLFDSEAAFGLTIGSATTAGTIQFPARTVGRGQNLISCFDLGPFLGDPDPVMMWGYNITQTAGFSTPGEPRAYWSIEGYYNDGTGDPKIESYYQIDGLTGQGANQFRPWFCIANRDTANILVRYAADLHQFFPADLTGGASVLDIYPANSPAFDFKKTVRISALAQSTGLQLADNTGTPITFTATPNWATTGAPAIVTGGAYGFSMAPGGLEALRIAYVSGAVNFGVINGSATTGTVVFAADGSDSDIGIAIAAKGADVIDLYTGGAFTSGVLSSGNKQVQITHTASANRNITLTGSNGGNPTIGTSAGNLAITPAVVVAATSGSAIGTTTSSTTVLNLPAGSTAASSIRLAHGAAPSSPVNGDMWTTTTGLFVRINGSTVGPLT